MMKRNPRICTLLMLVIASCYQIAVSAQSSTQDGSTISPSLGPGKDNLKAAGSSSSNQSGDAIPYGPGIANSGIANPDDINGNGDAELPAGQRPATDNCADPANVDLSRSLAESADIVITGLVVVDAGTAPMFCAPTNSTLQSLPANASPSTIKGPDLLVDVRKGNSSSSKEAATLLVAVQCVHKGALACRRNKADNAALADAAGRCVIAVKVPPQTSKDTCTVYSGYRYTIMLSSQPAADCDGAYTIANSKVTQSFRPHLSMGGANVCPPYPAWPSQSTSSDGDGLANLISQKCPGAANPKRIKCSNPCEKQQCAKEAGVTCVVKACEGRFMLQDSMTPIDACVPVFISKVTGLPVAGCEVTGMQLQRQQRQAQRRVGLLTGQVTPSVDGTGTPRIVEPQSLFAGKFASALGAAMSPDQQQGAGNGAVSTPEGKP